MLNTKRYSGLMGCVAELMFVCLIAVLLFCLHLYFDVYNSAQAAYLESKPISYAKLDIKIPAIPEIPKMELTIDDMVDEIASSYGLEKELIHAIIFYESSYNPDCKNYDGTCVGLMQVSTRWHKERAFRLGVTDFFDPYSNILLGCDYMSELLNTYHDESLCLMIYNMGPKKASAFYARGETTSYARNVLNRKNLLKEGKI